MDQDFEDALMLDDAIDENEVNEGLFKLKELFNAVNAMVLSIIAVPDDEPQSSSQPLQCSSQPPPSTEGSAPSKMDTSADDDEGKSANEPEQEEPELAEPAEEDKINKPN